MKMSKEQQHQLNRLMDYRDQISDAILHVEQILKDYFPDQHSLAYQHWIPQIVTALNDDSKWLSRGVYSFQNTIDKINDIDDNTKGLTKVI